MTSSPPSAEPILAEPIDPEAYAPFGQVVQARGEDTAREANHGAAQAWFGLAQLENRRGEAARGSASLFRCEAPAPGPIHLRWLERHPHATQLFVPMQAERYLVVVARGAEAPDLGTLRAFVVPGDAAITYAPGTWHHPMIALDRPTDFVNVLFVDGTPGDCEEVAMPPGWRVTLPPPA